MNTIFIQTDEEKFILNASRLNLSEGNITLLKKISNRNIDWNLLYKKASYNGVSTFIYYSLKKCSLTQLVPTDVFSRFEKDYHVNVSKNVRFIKKIHEIADIVQEKIILLKGGYLINYFYPDIGIRSMGDIDFLVERDRAVHIWNLLQSNKFENHGPHWHGAVKSTVHAKVVPFHHLDLLCSDNCDIEIHSNLFEYHDFFDVTKKALKKSVLIDSEKTLYRLSNEFFLIHLCSHFYLHNYLHGQEGNNIRMLCDINEFILKRGQNINWDEIDEDCSDLEMKNRVSVPLTYAYYFLQTPVPANFILKNLINDNSMSVDSINCSEMLNIQRQKSNQARFFFRLKSFKNPFDVLLFIARTVVPEKEWIITNFNTKKDKGLMGAYFCYWSYLLNRYVLKKV